MWKLVGWGVGALAIVAFVMWLNGVLDERAALKDWQTGMVEVIKAEVPVERRRTLNKGNAADEVRWLGREYRSASSALERQFAEVRAANRRAGEALEAVENARKGAIQRNEAREAARTRLTDPERTDGLTAAEWGEL